MLRKYLLAIGGAAALLSACATAPRGPAARLAIAGQAATNAFSADVNLLATQLIQVGAQEGYTQMWQACQSGAGCPESLPASNLAAQRLRLAQAVRLRGQALDQLGRAYQALAKEAEYDGAADAQGAAVDAIKGVNAFTAAVTAAGGPAIPVISELATTVISGIAGIIGDQRQRDRIISDSRQIAKAVEGLRDGLRGELFVFRSLAGYLGNIRTELRISLLQAGLISQAEALRPLTATIGATPVGNAEAILAGNDVARRSLEQAVRAGAEVEILQAQARYEAAIEALGALLAAHRRLETEGAVTLADVDRLIGRFTATLQADAADREGER